MRRVGLDRCVTVVGSAPLWGLLLLACATLAPPAAAHPEPSLGPPPESFTQPACYQLARREGRMIAWARWEQGYTRERMEAGQFAEATPGWMVHMVQSWIADAYSWEVTDQQIYEWAKELGNTDHLPSATGLSRHERIAIWMRRIARQCEGQNT